MHCWWCPWARDAIPPCFKGGFVSWALSLWGQRWKKSPFRHCWLITLKPEIWSKKTANLKFLLCNRVTIFHHHMSDYSYMLCPLASMYDLCTSQDQYMRKRKAEYRSGPDNQMLLSFLYLEHLDICSPAGLFALVNVRLSDHPGVIKMTVGSFYRHAEFVLAQYWCNVNVYNVWV